MPPTVRSGTPAVEVRPDPLAPPPWGAIALFATTVGVLALAGPQRDQVPWALVPWSLATLVLLHLWLRHSSWIGGGHRLLLGAVLLRILFLLPPGGPPLDLSDDLFRYVWDGWLGSQGIPPYRLRPEDPSLAAFQEDALFSALNSPGYFSVYPPLSQLVFLAGGAAHTLGGWPLSGWVIRLLMTGLELGGITLLLAATRAARWGLRAQGALVLYAWNPLPLLVVAGGGHSEGGLVFALGLLAFGVARGRPALAWIAWVLAVASKGIPLLLAPLVWRLTKARNADGGPSRRLRDLLPAGGVGLLLALPFLPLASPALLLQDLGRALQSARLYVELFAFNSGLPALLAWGVDAIPWGPGPGWVAPALQGGAVVGALGIGLRIRRRDPEGLETLARGGLLVFSLYLVASSTLHPWYLLWGLPLAALLAGRGPSSDPFPPTSPPTVPWLWAPWLWAGWAALPTYLFYAGVSATGLALLFWGGASLVCLTGALAGSVHRGTRPVPLREAVLRPLRRHAARRKARWIHPWVAGTRVVDVGGGEGDTGHHLARLAPGREVVVVDPDPSRTRGTPPRVQGSALRLPLADAGAETVVLSFVLHHLEDPDQGLREALRVARRRVVILESTYRTEGGRRVLRFLDRWVNAGRGSGEMGAPHAPLHHRPASRWAAAAQAAGGRVVHAASPGGWVHRCSPHRVLVLVLEPGSEGSAQTPEELRP